jgi:hypothetical protein
MLMRSLRGFQLKYGFPGLKVPKITCTRRMDCPACSEDPTTPEGEATVPPTAVRNHLEVLNDVTQTANGCSANNPVVRTIANAVADINEFPVEQTMSSGESFDRH